MMLPIKSKESLVFHVGFRQFVARFEDEYHEDNCNKFRSRETNRVTLDDYLTTVYGDFLLQQRPSIENWIIDASLV